MNRNKMLPLTETTFYVLLALRKQSHGYEIMQTVEELSGGTVRIAAGTMYGSIENLLKLKWIGPHESDDPRRKIYAITDAGEGVLLADIERLKHMVQVAERSE